MRYIAQFGSDRRRNRLFILVQQSQPALRIAAVGGAAGLLVDAGGDHHQRGSCEAVIVDSADLGVSVNKLALLP